MIAKKIDFSVLTKQFALVKIAFCLKISAGNSSSQHNSATNKIPPQFSSLDDQECFGHNLKCVLFCEITVNVADIKRFFCFTFRSQFPFTLLLHTGNDAT